MWNLLTEWFVFIPLYKQSVAKPCSSSSWGETMLIEFKMARVVKTNLTYGTILSNIIVKINLKKGAFQI